MKAGGFAAPVARELATAILLFIICAESGDMAARQNNRRMDIRVITLRLWL